MCFCKCFRRLWQVFQPFRMNLANVSSGCFKSRSGCCTCCKVTHLSQPLAAPAWAPCMRVGERRNGALLGSGCGKWRAMAAGAQAVPARHAGAASGGVRADRGTKWSHSFLGATNAGIKHTNGLQPRASLRGRLSGRPGACSADI
jgi:hypothetical protein